ncbi:MAG TPA: helix-hairpin-helix domain-containing protein, partial [Casimicrobiaceae bacterium]|nr:helix-hairpin-helix domain-containing protein [Casimicrobiaceae bacterium]
MKRLVLLLVTVLFSALALAAVNINTANLADLEALPEIGPVKAQAIIDYRNANGPFKSPEDVMKVSGIKEGTYGKIKGLISVSGASTPLPATAPAKTAAPAPAPAPTPAPAPAAKTASPAATPPAAGAAGAASGTGAAAAKDAKSKDATMTKKEKAAADKAAKAKAKEDA